MIVNYYYEMTVTGRGAFPMDMLRYARAFPVDATDAELMEPPQPGERPRGKRSVKVGLYTGQMCVDNIMRRFDSFGWKSRLTVEERLARR